MIIYKFLLFKIMNYMIITSSEMIVYSETDSIFKIRERGSKIGSE